MIWPHVDARTGLVLEILVCRYSETKVLIISGHSDNVQLWLFLRFLYSNN